MSAAIVQSTDIHGCAWKYGDNVNTDVIFPGKYTYTLRQPEEIARHALEDLDPTFAQQVQPGDIIVAGRNWGCGSSREQAATCLVYSQVGAVIAESFGRIFYRNAINSGLPVITCPAAAQALCAGDQVTVDLDACVIQSGSQTFPFPPMSNSVRAILQAGGLIAYTTKRLRNEAAVG